MVRGSSSAVFLVRPKLQNMPAKNPPSQPTLSGTNLRIAGRGVEMGGGCRVRGEGDEGLGTLGGCGEFVGGVDVWVVGG